jgi:hypothetical protein
MLVRLRKRISSAHLLAFAALFVALGGMAYALTRNEVKSKHIAPGAVKLSDLNKNVRTEAFEVTDATGEPGGSFDFDDADALITSLPLKKGSYVISSTFQMFANSPGLVLRCQLRAGSSRDEVEHFGYSGNNPGALGVAHRFASNGTAQLRCLDGSPADNSDISNIEIIATKVAKVRGG